MTTETFLRTDSAAEAQERAQFARLWERERPRVWRLVARVSGSTDAADDLTQEVGIRALQAFGGFRNAASGATRLHRIAVNVAVRWREQADAWNSKTVSTNADTADTNTPERQLFQADAAERTRYAIDALPEELRIIMVLHAWEGLKYREIAALLEIPQGTVMSRLHAARTRLRRELEDSE